MLNMHYAGLNYNVVIYMDSELVFVLIPRQLRGHDYAQQDP